MKSKIQSALLFPILLISPQIFADVHEIKPLFHWFAGLTLDGHVRLQTTTQFPLLKFNQNVTYENDFIMLVSPTNKGGLTIEFDYMNPSIKTDNQKKGSVEQAYLDTLNQLSYLTPTFIIDNQAKLLSISGKQDILKNLTDTFKKAYPNIDKKTGLHYQQLLAKAVSSKQFSTDNEKFWDELIANWNGYSFAENEAYREDLKSSLNASNNQGTSRYHGHINCNLDDRQRKCVKFTFSYQQDSLQSLVNIMQGIQVPANFPEPTYATHYLSTLITEADTLIPHYFAIEKNMDVTYTIFKNKTPSNGETQEINPVADVQASSASPEKNNPLTDNQKNISEQHKMTVKRLTEFWFKTL